MEGNCVIFLRNIAILRIRQCKSVYNGIDASEFVICHDCLFKTWLWRF